MKFEEIKKWAIGISGAIAVCWGGIWVAYDQLEAKGMIGGQLEKANMILAEQHIGEEPTKKTTIIETAGERQAVLNYENGDTLFFWKYKDTDGDRQKIKRWTSKKSVEEIIKMASEPWYVPNPKTAHAQTGGYRVYFDEDEVYVGKTADGTSIYHVLSEDICDFVDEGTGNVIDSAPPPVSSTLIPDGALCFSFNKKHPLSKVLAWATKSEYSHSFIYGGLFYGTPFVIEMAKPKAKLTPWAHYKTGYRYVVFYPKHVSQDEIYAALNKAVDSIEQELKYSYRRIFENAFWILFGKEKKWTTSKDLVCSTLQLKYLNALPGELFSHLDPKYVTPQEILSIIQSSGEFFQVEIGGE